MSTPSRSPLSSRRRRSHSEMTNGDDDEPSNQYSEDVKRARLNPTKQDSGTGDNSRESSGKPEQPFEPLVARPGVDSKGYKPGAIIRIKVTDFVTYTKAEFYPGPKLNMVIGPNGTGKSTLVCAICLGLGWGPQHLGRAKELGEFVKHGRPEATIEIELAGGPTIATNPIIKRKIKRDGNHSSFWVNGTPVSAKNVLRLVQSFAIQVDNLCQFLPQDKVAEFAALTPEQLLYSTERAAGGKRMIDWHDALNKLREEQRKIEIDNRGDTETLRNMETRHEAQKEDVERMRERVVIQQKINNMEFLRPIVEFRDFVRFFDELKTKRNRLEEEQRLLKEELMPMFKVVEDKKAYADKIDEVKTLRREQVAQLSNAAEEAKNKITELQDEMTAIDNQIDNERNSGKRQKEEASKISQTIRKLERQMQKKPRQEKRRLEEQISEISEKRDPLQRQIDIVTRRKNLAQRNLENLSSKSGQKENLLRSVSPDTAKGYQWLLDNQHRFEKEVFGPPMVTCSVSDPKYADAIESFIQKAELTAFTVQSKNDFRTLQQALIKELNLHDISIRTCPAGSGWKRSPIPKEDIERMGYDGWASDFIKGPEPVISMLYEESKLGSTPIAIREISEEAYEETTNGPIVQFVSGRTVYQISRRREMDPERRLPERGPVDMSAKQEYLNEIGSSKDELEHLYAELGEETRNFERLQDEIKALDQDMKNIEKEKAERQTAHTNFLAIPQRLEQEQSKLYLRQEGFTEIRERVHNLRYQQDEIAIKKAEATVRYADSIEGVREAYEELLKAEILHMEAISDWKTLKARESDSARMLEEKSRTLREAAEEMDRAKRQGKALRHQSKQIEREIRNREGADEVHESFLAPDYDMDAYNADLDSEKARLALTHGGHSGMIEEFEARERKIQELKEKLSGFIQERAKIQESIDEVRGLWEPQLDAIVSKISDAFGDSFRRIGLAGQVSLFKAEDEPGPNGEPGASNFEQWAIQIQVKFREHEPLSILTAHRQSGGERAVSTIFYLMALQSLSASPFRVVDEINQGMDPRNERMVHGRLVDIACGTEDGATAAADSIGGGGGSQYFLITPKLLTGLAYKRGMKVLTIYSGEYMPEDYGKLDFRVAAQKMRTITGRQLRRRNPVDVY
ncbi:hypothetical protein N7468_000603 [Penicillium chermesinum]|uniref:Structural maintenance of chromosomes protein 5 n=1 Tax=Penicillium chermesinum TaxID=63820 RepID=A0A9W9PKM8_9EURO|nr:uncharacterized protein N7468_000603 [Penicillium chermesinum]KAJ5249152.1 hypothetical protein N7468_000603 [Penicillium chermesinum]